MNDAMTEIWTAEEIEEFDNLTLQLSSQRQMERISARLAIKAFEAKHGTAKCQAMFDVLKARDAK
ncbi:hypothetical protein [Mesorhizobium sp.]|uniref:hypothetical protein n=1 Tax=Mesorhizobium sp. TaxID=1871066 RepID=UPI000FE77599|nr:hypothetical protein [Mesorhizobium sp.]RWN33413.1 MAG: hypothetical protein EOR95_15810 [Mesorhizobium sp.]